MVKHDIIVGLLRVAPLDGVCEGCVLENHHQIAFEVGKDWREKAKLELAHHVLCSLKKSSLIGVRFIFTFIDDIYRYTWVCFLKNKDHVFEKNQGN